MREPTYFVLVSLMAGPMHGYGVAKRAEELSDGAVTLTAGTLYGALERLVVERLIEEDRSEIVNGRPRRYYRITDDGRRAVSGEVQRMQAAVRAAVGNGLPTGLAGAQ